MNIVLVVYSHYSRDARVRRYAECLAGNGYLIDVICLNEEYKPKEKNITLIKYPFGRRRYGKFWYFLEYILFFLYTSMVLAVIFPQKKYKLIHINNMPDFLVFASFIPKLFGTKIILDLHDPMPELYLSKYHAGINNIMVRFLKWLEGKSINFSDCVITANPVFKEIFLSRNNIPSNKINVILNSPDGSLFKPRKLKKSKSKYFNLLYMGTIEERFGLDVVVDSFPNLVVKIPNIRFTIIPKLENEGLYFKDLKNKIEKLNLSQYIIFKSPVPLENIIKEIQEADIGIVLANYSKFTDSIIPVKLLEFVLMGKPVIATKTKILGNYFCDRQILFLKHNNTEEFVQAIMKIKNNKKMKNQLVRLARVYFVTNNWIQQKEKYFRILKPYLE